MSTFLVMKKTKNITISKLDAARRQLETAIRLYFANGDPVSIHTLAAAAYNIVKDVNKNRGGTPLFLKEEFLDYIKEGHEKEVRKLINAAENFFKHADYDHDAIFDFNPGHSEMLIHEACRVFQRLTGEQSFLFKLFQIWFATNNPLLFRLPEEYKRILESIAAEFPYSSREIFFAEALPLVLKPF